MSQSKQIITFLAHFPAIQSAIRVGDDGMRIQLQITESEMANALWLIQLRDKRLKVSIEEASDDDRTDKEKRITTPDFDVKK
jgi:hypothetical protein